LATEKLATEKLATEKLATEKLAIERFAAIAPEGLDRRGHRGHALRDDDEG